jgi:hypothetical protein
MSAYFGKSGVSFSCGALRCCLLAGALSLPGCGRSEHRYVVFYENLEPKQAAVIGSFLDEFHEKSRMTVVGKTLTIEVPRNRLDLLKHYMTAPVDSESHIRLVRNAFVADRDSAKTASITASKKSERLMRLVAPSEGQSDSLRIGVAFDRVFERPEWKCYRTPDYKIHVEFTGAIPPNIRAGPEKMRVVVELVSHRRNLLLEIGPENSLWRFRWLVGIDGRSFKKESLRVVPGRFRPEGGKPARETEYISL